MGALGARGVYGALLKLGMFCFGQQVRDVTVDGFAAPHWVSSEVCILRWCSWCVLSRVVAGTHVVRHSLSFFWRVGWESGEFKPSLGGHLTQ